MEHKSGVGKWKTLGLGTSVPTTNILIIQKKTVRNCGSMGISIPFPACTLSQPPTGPFTISEPQNQETGDFDLVPKRDTLDFEASKFFGPHSPIGQN